MFLNKIVNRLFSRLADPFHDILMRRRIPDAASQINLMLTYKQILYSGMTLPGFHDVGFKIYSQTDEDGILLFIFSVIGTTNKKCVEICAGNGIECNTANLIINHGWTGLLVDGNQDLVRQGNEYYGNHPCTRIYPPRFICSWITRTNVNKVLEQNGFTGEMDLLSLDMDGVDYWIWETLEAVAPRVVVLEYQDILGPERSLTVPYSDTFDAYQYPTTGNMPNFSGASLSAFVKLAHKKGYRLVGCNRYGYNAFFIRKGIGDAQIPEISISECFRHPKVLWGMKNRWPMVKDLPWIEV